MTGLRTISEMRRAGVKPKSVFVELVDRLGPYDAEQFSMSPSGVVVVNITQSDSLTGIDFRPLVGLVVHLTDHAGDAKRFRCVANLIAAAEPAHLVMPVWEGDTLVVHQRWAGDPARTETFRI